MNLPNSQDFHNKLAESFMPSTPKSCSKQEENPIGSLEELIKWHQKLRPNFEIVDVYKMLYQSVFGVGHILHEKARQHLKNELSSLNISEFPDEPLIENISTDGSMIRVNLSPFKRQGLSPDKLFYAMLTSAKNSSGTKEAFLKLWNEFKHLVETGKLEFDKTRLEDFDRKIREENFPIYHHSEKYRKSYKPAYRVLKRKVFQTIFKIEWKNQ